MACRRTYPGDPQRDSGCRLLSSIPSIFFDLRVVRYYSSKQKSLASVPVGLLGVAVECAMLPVAVAKRMRAD